MTAAMAAPTSTAEPTLTVLLPDLLDALGTVGAAIPTRPQLPILGGVLVEVAGGVTTLSGFDFDTSVRVTVDGVASDGRALLSHAELVKILKAATKGETRRTWQDWTVHIADGAVTVAGFTVPVTQFDVNDYPDLPAPSAATTTVSLPVLSELLRQVTVAAGTDGTLPVFTGVRVELDGHTLTAACTDRFRLTVANVPATSTATGAWLLPVAELRKVVKTLAGGDVAFGLPADGRWATVQSGNVTATVQLMGHEFPRYQQLMPSEVTHHATVDRSALRKAAVKAEALAAALQRGNIVKVTITDGCVTVAPMVGEHGDRVRGVDVPAETAGDVVFAVSGSRGLTDALDSLTGETVAFGLTTPNRPILFANDLQQLTGSGAPYRHLVMPYRLPS